MYILNITFLVATDTIGIWSEWVHGELIPAFIASGEFHTPQLARVHAQTGEDGTSFALQVHSHGLDAINSWMNNQAPDMQQVCTGRFHEKVLFFATTLELIS